MILQVTETDARSFDLHRLTTGDAPALRALCPGGLPHAPGLQGLLQTGAVLGDYGNGPALRAALPDDGPTLAELATLERALAK